jgi:hypothetical protein
MAKNQKRILEMLANKEISTDEAQRMLGALDPEVEEADTPTGREPEKVRTKPRYLRVSVRPGAGHENDADAERVNVRVPLALIRSGIKFASVLPRDVGDRVEDTLKDRGIGLDLRNLNPDDLDDFIEALADLEVDVESNEEKVKVFVE